MNPNTIAYIRADARDAVKAELSMSKTVDDFIYRMKAYKQDYDELPCSLDLDDKVELIEESKAREHCHPFFVYTIRSVIEEYAIRAYNNLVMREIRSGFASWIGEVVLCLPSGIPFTSVLVLEAPPSIGSDDWECLPFYGVDIYFCEELK